jgi:hypothetical protein
VFTSVVDKMSHPASALSKFYKEHDKSISSKPVRIQREIYLYFRQLQGNINPSLTSRPDVKVKGTAINTEATRLVSFIRTIDVLVTRKQTIPHVAL